MMAPSNIDRLQVSPNQVDASYSGGTTRHKCQDDQRRTLDVTRGPQNKAKESQTLPEVRGNTNHPLHTTINRRLRNGWTTEIQECHRLASRQLEEPT